jgi:hypothetical protein
MPRGPRGGVRAGAPGETYSNRTDLNVNRDLPARVATGQTYGRAQAQLQAQRTVPMAPPPQLPVVANQGGPPPAGPPAAPAAGPGAAAPAPPPIAPGQAGPVDRPTERPWEAVTHGAPVGPGAGPEVLPQGPASPMGTNLSQLLAQVARSSGSSVVAQLAASAAATGQ